MLLSDVLYRDRFGGHREDKDVTAQAKITLRRWRDGDLDSLVRYANNRAVWLNLRDRFPYPYTRGDAEGWIALCKSEQEPALQFAIELDGEAIGGVGLENLDDVYRMTADIGYWVAEPFWGRGIATTAVIETTAYAFARSLSNDPGDGLRLEPAIGARSRKGRLRAGRNPPKQHLQGRTPYRFASVCTFAQLRFAGRLSLRSARLRP